MILEKERKHKIFSIGVDQYIMKDVIHSLFQARMKRNSILKMIIYLAEESCKTLFSCLVMALINH